MGSWKAPDTWVALWESISLIEWSCERRMLNGTVARDVPSAVVTCPASASRCVALVVVGIFAHMLQPRRELLTGTVARAVSSAVVTCPGSAS